MTAKISDLGVARIFNKLTPLQVSRMTQTPGTPAYMPPEVMVANPKYNTSVDEFSYGIMMIHMFSGQWPEPQIGPNQIEGGQLIPITEAEWREKFLKAIEDDYPLMDLIHMCINNDPQLRPHAGEIIRRVSRVAAQFPAFFANRLEMLRQIERGRREKTSLMEEGERKECIILEKSDEILTHKKEIQALSEEGQKKQSLILSLRTQNVENEAEIVKLKSNCSALETQLRETKRQLRKEKKQLEIQLAKEKQLSAEEREANRKLMSDVSKLQSDITAKNTVIEIKEGVVRRKDSELEAKSRALGEKDATISAMSEQITEASLREYLATKQQVSTYSYLLFSGNLFLQLWFTIVCAK